MKGRSLQEAIKDTKLQRGPSAGCRSQRPFLGLDRAFSLGGFLVTREVTAPGAC